MNLAHSPSSRFSLTARRLLAFSQWVGTAPEQASSEVRCDVATRTSPNGLPECCLMLARTPGAC
jgi:hypothetical protein